MNTDLRKQYPSKPNEVQTAVTILLACFGIGLLNTFFVANHAHLPDARGVQLTVFGFEAAIIAAIARGRNWARILYLILSVGGLFSVVLMNHLLIRINGPLSFYLELGECILQMVAMLLLFQRNSSEWFRGGQRPERPELTPRERMREQGYYSGARYQ